MRMVKGLVKTLIFNDGKVMIRSRCKIPQNKDRFDWSNGVMRMVKGLIKTLIFNDGKVMIRSRCKIPQNKDRLDLKQWCDEDGKRIGKDSDIQRWEGHDQDTKSHRIRIGAMV